MIWSWSPPVVIAADDEHTPAHWLVLSVASSYFRLCSIPGQVFDIHRSVAREGSLV